MLFRILLSFGKNLPTRTRTRLPRAGHMPHPWPCRGAVVVSEASRSPRRRQDSVWISAAAPAHLAEQTPVECLTGLVARSGLLPVLLLRSSTSAECTSVVSPGAQSQAGCAALLGRGRWGLALMPSLLSSRSASPAHLGREGSWLSGSSIGDSRPIL